jgi:ribosome recycling factor
VLEYVRKEYNDRAKKLEKDYEIQKEDLMRQNKKDVENLLEG